MKLSFKNFVISVLFLMIILSGIENILTLGITPGRTTVDYENGVEKDFTFSVLNNEHKHMQVVLMAQGELNDSIKIYTSEKRSGIIDFLPSEASKQFSYKIKFPKSIEDKPGLHTAEIVALEIPQVSGEDSYVGATVAVVSQVYVYVACPGKCIDADFEILDAEKNTTATVIIPVINRGKVGIGNARAIIDIYNFDYEKKDSITTDSWPIEPGARSELSAKWNVNLNAGNYIAKVSVVYDGETINFEKQFTIGDQLLTIESILVNDFQLGEIAKLHILVENKWNQELENVFANLLIYNTDKQVMADIKSSNENIASLAKKTLIAYWDTVGVSEGEYNGKLMVVHNKKSIDKNLVLKVRQNSLDIFGVGYTIQPRGDDGFDITSILILLVIILLIVNLSWFVFYKRMKGKR